MIESEVLGKFYFWFQPILGFFFSFDDMNMFLSSSLENILNTYPFCSLNFGLIVFLLIMKFSFKLFMI